MAWFLDPNMKCADKALQKFRMSCSDVHFSKQAEEQRSDPEDDEPMTGQQMTWTISLMRERL